MFEEAALRHSYSICLPSSLQVTVFDEKDVQAGRASMQRAFEFDGVFPPDSSQAELFEAVGQPVLDGVLAGYDGTILAYGQVRFLTLKTILPFSHSWSSCSFIS